MVKYRVGFSPAVFRLMLFRKYAIHLTTNIGEQNYDLNIYSQELQRNSNQILYSGKLLCPMISF